MRNAQHRCASVEMVENFELSLMSSINKCIQRCGVSALFPDHYDMMCIIKDYNYPISPVKAYSALAPVGILCIRLNVVTEYHLEVKGTDQY